MKPGPNTGITPSWCLMVGIHVFFFPSSFLICYGVDHRRSGAYIVVPDCCFVNRILGFNIVRSCGHSHVISLDIYTHLEFVLHRPS